MTARNSLFRYLLNMLSLIAFLVSTVSIFYFYNSSDSSFLSVLAGLFTATVLASLFTLVFYLVLKGIFLLLSRSFREANAADAKADTLKYYQQNQTTDGCYFTSPIKNKLGEGFKVYPESITLLPSNERITFDEIEAVEITTSRWSGVHGQLSDVQIFLGNGSTHPYRWYLRAAFTSIPDMVRNGALPTLLQELGFKTVPTSLPHPFWYQDKRKLIYAPRS